MHGIDIRADKRIVTAPTESIHLKSIGDFFRHIVFRTSIAVLLIIDIDPDPERVRGQFTPCRTGISFAARTCVYVAAEYIGAHILDFVRLAGKFIGRAVNLVLVERL